MKSKITLLFMALIFLAAGQAAATVDQAKTYQKVFGGDKPKCIHCHVDKIPKKDDGKHELNEYGKKLAAAKTGEVPDAATYQAVGKGPEEA